MHGVRWTLHHRNGQWVSSPSLAIRIVLKSGNIGGGRARAVAGSCSNVQQREAVPRCGVQRWAAGARQPLRARRDPVGPNSNLGTYTNFVNLLDMCGLAVPVPPRTDGRPGSVTLLGAAGEDARLAEVALALESAGTRSLGATGWPFA